MTLTENEPPDTKSGVVSIIIVLRRRYRLILLCILVAAGSAFAVSLFQQKQYTATASLLFRDPGFAQNIFSGESGASSGIDPNRQAATNLQLVELQIVGKRAAERLDLGMTSKELQGQITIGAQGNSDVVSVEATDPEPETARLIADAFASEFIAFRAEADRSKLLEAKRLADREFEALDPEEQQGVRGRQLSQGSERLGILASLQTGNAELVQRAVLPETPSSPKPLRNGVIGGFLGLILGIGLAFGFERFSRQLRDPDEAREAFGLPVLATVPDSEAIVHSNEGQSVHELPFVEAESFRMLRASLRYFNIDNEIKSVLITSSSAQVGKSTVSWNLARYATTTSRVVIVETDLRKPSLARQHGVKVGPGLAEILTHQIGLDEAVQTIQIDKTRTEEEGPGATLDLIVAGSVPPNPAELLESNTMAETLSELKERYDLVIIDTAPTGVVADAFPLVGQVDGVVIVARMGQTTQDEAETIRAQLDRLDAPLLGIVTNGVKVKRGGKYGGYGYYGTEEGAKANAAVAARSSN